MKCGWRIGIGLLAGVVAGSVPVAVYYHRQMETVPPQWVRVSSTGEALRDVGALIRLRRDEKEALIDELETDLSCQLSALVCFYPNDALSEKRTVRILEVVAAYRAKHPFKTGNADIDHRVAELLSQVEARQKPGSNYSVDPSAGLPNNTGRQASGQGQ